MIQYSYDSSLYIYSLCIVVHLHLPSIMTRCVMDKFTPHCIVSKCSQLVTIKAFLAHVHRNKRQSYNSGYGHSKLVIKFSKAIIAVQCFSPRTRLINSMCNQLVIYYYIQVMYFKGFKTILS